MGVQGDCIFGCDAITLLAGKLQFPLTRLSSSDFSRKQPRLLDKSLG